MSVPAALGQSSGAAAFGGMLIAAMLGTASQATAQSEVVAVEVTATVPPRCGFADTGVVALTATTDLELPGQLATNIQLDCNTPFALGVSTNNGAMVNVSSKEDGSGYAFRKSYFVSVSFDTDKGHRSGGRCVANELKPGGSCAFAGTVAGTGLSSGDGISIGRRAALTIDWPAQSNLPNRLAAGRYEDTITLIIGARV